MHNEQKGAQWVQGDGIYTDYMLKPRRKNIMTCRNLILPTRDTLVS